MGNPREASLLVNEAIKKAEQNIRGPLREVWDSLQTMFSLAKDWAAGNYKAISARSILMIMAGLVYFVTPIDIIPEFIAGLGLVDDAMILSFIISQLNKDLEEYREWKRNH